MRDTIQLEQAYQHIGGWASKAALNFINPTWFITSELFDVPHSQPGFSSKMPQSCVIDTHNSILLLV